jgi:hypothetical protein
LTARTRVGIVEWARRAQRARHTEMSLAELLAAEVREAPDVAAKVALVRRARLHAWHADLWKSVTPLLHDVSPGGIDVPGADADTRPESILEKLDRDYRAWREEAGPLAEAPLMRVLGLVARDHDEAAAG